MQSMIVLALVALAAAYLAWHVIGPFVRRAGKAAGCHGCAAACQAKVRPAPGEDGRTVIWMHRSDEALPRAGRRSSRLERL